MDKKYYSIKIFQLNFLIKNLQSKLLKCKFDKIIKNGSVKVKEYATDRYLIDLSTEEKSSLLDELTILFTSKGMNNNSESNELGILIEELIDIFSK
jgi:hypothetical protein